MRRNSALNSLRIFKYQESTSGKISIFFVKGHQTAENEIFSYPNFWGKILRLYKFAVEPCMKFSRPHTGTVGYNNVYTELNFWETLERKNSLIE